MDDLTYGYRPAGEDGSDRHMWTLKGQRGGVHIWARPNDPEWQAKWGEWFVGGVEVHSPVPMYERDGPNHENCFLLGGPCWHDGTSLYFSEKIEPMLRCGAPFPDAIREFVESILFDFYQSNLPALPTPTTGDSTNG